VGSGEGYKRQIKAHNDAAQRAADEANQAAREALQALQKAAEEAYRVANDIANAWIEALSSIGLGAEATALQRRLQSAAMDPALRAAYEQVWAIQDRVALKATQDDLAIKALGLLGRDEDMIAAERALLLAQTPEEMRGFQEWIFQLEDAQKEAEEAAKGIMDLIDSLKQVSEAIGNVIDSIDAMIATPVEIQAQRRREAQDQILALIDAAKAGEMPTMAMLEKSLNTLSQDPIGMYGDRVSYMRDLGLTRARLAELQKLVDDQIPIEEQNLEALKNLPVELYPHFEEIVEAIGQSGEDTDELLRNATAAVEAAIEAMAARDAAMEQAVKDIVPEIREIPPYVEDVYEELDIVGKELNTNLDSVRALLWEIDANGDQQITEAEMISALQHVINRDDIQEIFRGLDINQDGVIDAIEMSTGDLTPLLRAIDLDGDGNLKWSEFQSSLQYLASDDELRNIFNLLDQNQDGLISKLELQYQSLQSLANDIALKMAVTELQVKDQVSFAEFKTMFAGLASDAEMQFWFDRLDIDQDGILSKHEIEIGKLTTGNTNETEMLSYLLNVIGKLETENANSATQISKLNDTVAKLQTENANSAMQNTKLNDTIAKLETGNANSAMQITKLNDTIAKLETGNANSAMQITKLNDTIAKLQAQITELTTIKTNTTTLKDNETTKISYQSKLPPMLDRLLNVEQYTYDTRNDSHSYFPYMSDRLHNAEIYTYRTQSNTSDTTKNTANLLRSNAINYPTYYWPSYATGGISAGPTSGYPVTLHGREAVIPLGDGNSVTAILQDPTPPPNYLTNEAADTLELRRALEELHQELAALRRDTQTIGAATAGELKEHNRRERRRDVNGTLVEVMA